LEEAHLDMRSQFIDELNILDLQMLFHLLAQPLVQLLNDVILPLLRLHACGYHAFGGKRDNLLEVKDD
jgi:hypothetical protein